MSTQHKKKSILHNITALASSQFAGSLIRFMYMLVLARMLGPEQTGVYLYGVALYLGVINIGLFGQNIFLAQRLGKHAGLLLPILHHSLTITLTATLIAAAGLTLFVWITEPEFILRLTVLCFVGAMIGRSMVIWVRGVYIAFERPRWIPQYEILFRGTEVLAGVATLCAGGGLLVICFFHFLFWALEAFFSLHKLSCEYPGALALGYRHDYLKKVARVSLLFLISTTAMAQFSQISVVLLRRLQPDGTIVGHFGLAMQFMTAMMIVPTAATQAFLPRLSRSFNHGGGEDLITAVKLTGILTLAGGVMAAAYGPLCISLVLGPDYAETAKLFRYLCSVFVPFAVTIFLGQCLNVINGQIKAMIITVGMTVIHAVLLAVFAADSPVIAAVASMIAATVVCMVIAMHQVSRQLKLPNNIWWLKFVFIVITIYIIIEIGWASLMITAPVALMAGSVLIWLLQFFDSHDIKTIRRLLGEF
jgi:O-antigen/teichoic acid export membrane protein